MTKRVEYEELGFFHEELEFAPNRFRTSYGNIDIPKGASKLEAVNIVLKHAFDKGIILGDGLAREDIKKGVKRLFGL